MHGVCAYGLFFLMIALVAGGANLANLSAPGADFQRLHRPVSAAERHAGIVRGTGTFRGTDPHGVCVVEYQVRTSNGRNNNAWRTQSSYATGLDSVFKQGRDAWTVAPADFTFDPWLPTVLSGEEDARARQSLGFPGDGRVVRQCARPGRPVFVEGCVARGRTLGACPDGSLTVLTAGDGTPRARLAARASDIAGQLSVSYIALVLLALYGRRAARTAVPVDALRALHSAPEPPHPTGTYWLVGSLGAVACFALLVLPDRDSFTGGYALGAVALAIGAATTASFRARRAALRLASVSTQALETVPLARGGESPAEVAVRVRADAPTIQLPGHRPRAFVRVVLRARPSSASAPAPRVVTLSWPARLAVEDASGPGIVTLADADLDLRATFRTVARAEAGTLLAAYAATALGDDVPSWTNPLLEVSESYLDPGEALYLLGAVQHIPDFGSAGQYREATMVPVLTPTPDGTLIAHAGTKATLRASLRRERTYLAASAGVIAAAGLLLVVAFVYLRALV